MFKVRDGRFDGVKRSNSGHEGDLGRDGWNGRWKRTDKMSVDVGPRVDGSINVWVSGGEVMTSSAIDRTWSVQSKRNPDKGIMNWDGFGAVTVEFLEDTVRVRDV